MQLIVAFVLKIIERNTTISVHQTTNMIRNYFNFYNINKRRGIKRYKYSVQNTTNNKFNEVVGVVTQYNI